MNKVLRRQYGREACYPVGWGPEVPEGPSRHLGMYVGTKLQPGDIWYPEGLHVSARKFRALPEHRRKQIRVILWHMSFGLGEYLPRSSTSFTMLRRPVEQVLSGYYYTTDLESWLGDEDTLAYISDRIEPNIQTRMLAGPYADYTDDLPPSQEQLERAKDNLRSCAVVGLTERFDETLLLLRKTFGWKMPFYQRINVNRRRPPAEELPPETLAQILADNALDTELYQFACDLFEEQVEAYGPSFQRDLQLFRTLNRIWQRWQRLRRAASRVLRRGIRKAWPMAAPLYRILSQWGGLRHLLPGRFRPRAVVVQGPASVSHHLLMSSRVIGKYDFEAGRWVIRRPYHLFVKESELPQ